MKYLEGRGYMLALPGHGVFVRSYREFSFFNLESQYNRHHKNYKHKKNEARPATHTNSR